METTQGAMPSLMVDASDTFDTANDISLSPDGRVAIASGVGIVHLVDGSPEVLHEDSERNFVSLATLPSGAYVSWDLESGSLVQVAP